MTSQFKKTVDADNALAKNMAADALAIAKRLGADESIIRISSLEGLSISTRDGDVENIEFNKDRSMDITVYRGKKSGTASTSDFSAKAIEDTIEAALAISKHTDADPCAGILEAEYLSDSDYDFETLHEIEQDADAAVEKAVGLEREFMQGSYDRIKKSDGASLSSSLKSFTIASSNGFNRSFSYSSNGRSLSLLGQSDDKMQKGYGFTQNSNPELLYDNRRIIDEAVTKTLNKLDASQVKTGKYNVIFKGSAAISIWSALSKAIRGSLIYRDSSFLCNALDTKILPDFVSLRDEPFVKGELSSCNYDGEGCRVQSSHIVKDGILNMYLLGSYSARKLNMKPNGHASGLFTLYADFDDKHICTFDDMLNDVSEGIVIESLMGQGVNITNGDVSRGAGGYYFKDGRRVHAVEEITVAFNLKDLFKKIAMMSHDDIDERYSVKTGSILVPDVTISGL